MITVQTSSTLTPTQAWETWTQPQHIKNWCHASEDWHVTHATNDLTIGGSFNTGMAAKDGSFAFDWEGIYDEIVPLKLLKYHMADGRKVEVIFKETPQGTEITENFDPETENSEEMQQAGWQAILNNWKQYSESLY